MGWKKFSKDYLTFSRKDRIGIISILVLIGIIYLLPKIFSKKESAVAITSDTLLTNAADTLAAQQKRSEGQYNADDYNSNRYNYEPSTDYVAKGELFNFDPNTLSLDGWKRLGLPDRTVKTINNYRTKGGRFRKPSDVRKIWGLPPGFYERVEKYITIAGGEEKSFYQDQHSYSNDNYTATPRYEPKERRIEVVDVNGADTAAFIALPGIGSRLAYRITNFRDKLGGFYSVDQIGETYGLPDSTFQKLKPYFNVNAAAVRKININTATKDELKAHPYIKWNLANAIVEYRNQHGPFKDLGSLKNIALIDDATFAKIAPYLSLQ